MKSEFSLFLLLACEMQISMLRRLLRKLANITEKLIFSNTRFVEIFADLCIVSILNINKAELFKYISSDSSVRGGIWNVTGYRYTKRNL